MFVTAEAGFAVEGYEAESAVFWVKPDRLARGLKSDVLLAPAPDVEFSAAAVLLNPWRRPKAVKSSRFHLETAAFLVAGVGLEPTASGV